jgi:hypothetical protein
MHKAVKTDLRLFSASDYHATRLITINSMQSTSQPRVHDNKASLNASAEEHVTRWKTCETHARAAWVPGSSSNHRQSCSGYPGSRLLASARIAVALSLSPAFLRKDQKIQAMFNATQSN